jgi:hypothetical protein
LTAFLLAEVSQLGAEEPADLGEPPSTVASFWEPSESRWTIEG